MNKTSLLALAATVSATPAMAQDADWTGPYVGVSAGYTSAKSDSVVVLGGQWASESAALQTNVTENGAARQKLDNANFGAQLGYNYQMGTVVLGAEADFTALPGRNDVVRGPVGPAAFPTLTYTYTNRVDPKSSIALKAKLGVAAGNSLFYVDGGAAFTRSAYGWEVVSSGNYKKAGSLTKTSTGWTVGGGVEHKFTPNISARLSYNYVDAGDEAYATDYVAGSAFTSPVYSETITQDLRLHLVRVGLNFHF
ncbi:outer membrane beta-barrel protein [Novosphingobium sp. TH158]|uniref:outer membrane beta-barrel protein n=1 Tax=Novosphingobium sp. TH158 TaxID=2067455 RepID=UPI000C7DAD6C|nr:outer membrane beta-barrel protein [Novosphingobium sp. TH158]PLK25843.1 hypothetical protein C0V78_02270 [Novosphingobium sp. TH158]